VLVQLLTLVFVHVSILAKVAESNDENVAFAEFLAIKSLRFERLQDLNKRYGVRRGSVDLLSLLQRPSIPVSKNCTPCDTLLGDIY
jgi:hypothetical protein